MTAGRKAVLEDLGKKFSGGLQGPATGRVVAQSPLMTRRQAEKE
jgi:hypothetical protein